MATKFQKLGILGLVMTICSPAVATGEGQTDRQVHTIEDAVLLSAFGERPAFSPTGDRIAFVGKTFGDAYEIDLKTGSIRNLTGNIPHEGVLRIQYLSNGDYLITGPRRYAGRNSRFDSELWVLNKNLDGGLQPLGQKVFEGVAVSRYSSKIAWLEMGPGFERPRIENGQYIVPDPTKGELIVFTGDIVYENERPKLVNRTEVLRRVLPECGAEPQDFRNEDRELLVSCAAAPRDDGVWAASMGLDLFTGELTIYRGEEREYAEIEGISPDESWALVECGARTNSGIGPLDLCRLELTESGRFTPLVVTPRPSFRKTTNGVVNPNGKSIAFQSADSRAEYGTGDGIYLLAIDPAADVGIEEP